MRSLRRREPGATNVDDQIEPDAVRQQKRLGAAFRLSASRASKRRRSAVSGSLAMPERRLGLIERPRDLVDRFGGHEKWFSGVTRRRTRVVTVRTKMQS
jgi:hypothetical protein